MGREGVAAVLGRLHHPLALIFIGFALFVAFIGYSRAHNEAFASCDALALANEPARSELDFRWLPPRFECVLYDEDGSEIQRERVGPVLLGKATRRLRGAFNSPDIANAYAQGKGRGGRFPPSQ